MNIIKNLIDRVESYYATNKKPCKSYVSEEGAEKAAQQAAIKIADYFNEKSEHVDYVVFFVPAMNRWTVAFHISPLIRKHGGYVGISSELGYFSF